MDSKKVKVYKLIDVGELFKFEQLLPKLLFDLPRKTEDFTFKISSISGWIYYRNHAEVRSNSKNYLLPKNEIEVEKFAKQFFLRVEERLANERKRNPKFTLAKLLPTSHIEPVIEPVFHEIDDKQYIDHWLLRYTPTIRGNTGFNGSPIHVFGSTLSIRIGNGGKVIALSSNWRPIVKSYQLPILRDNQLQIAKTDHQHDESNSNDIDHNENENRIRTLEENVGSKFKLCYYVKGENIYQNYLCPIYADVKGHHVDFYPASKHSLVISIIEDHYNDQADLYASVKGGSGKFQIDWASWELAEGSTTFRELGNDWRVTLTPGVYNVALVVKDEQTGIIEQTISMVYVQKLKSIEKFV